MPTRRWLSRSLDLLRLLRPEEVCFLAFWSVGLAVWAIVAGRHYEFRFHLLVNWIPVLVLPFVLIAGLRRRLPGMLGVVRDWFGIWSAYVTYLSFHGMIFLVNPRPADATLIAIDAFLFGGDPSLMMQGLIHPRLTSLLDFFYLLYAIYPSMVLVLIYSSGERTRSLFREASLGLVLTLFLGYVGYVLVPARGPAFELADRYTVSLREAATGSVRENLVEMWRYAWDCFPSLHTACSVTILAYAFRYSLALGVLLAGPVFMTVFSCIYLRYHYGIDIIAGIALSILVVRSTGPLCRFWYDAPPEAGPEIL